MLEYDDEARTVEVTGYAQLKAEGSFGSEELRDVYMQQAVHDAKMEDSDRERVHKYFQQSVVR